MLKKLFLDLNNFKANLGSVERGDSIELNIKLLDSEDYSRSKFRVLGAKADGKYVEQIEGINLEEKDLKIVLEDQFVNCEGIVKLELNVVSGETEITTKEFYFFVSNTMNAEIIDSADSIPTLEKVSKYVDDAVNNLDALKEASEDITIINSEFKEAEIKRKANELLRERSEKERVRLESIRTTEEADRIKAEAERKEAENNRKVAESNRKLAENTRKTNEANRVRAELNRQSLFEENEEIRNENENLRIEAEKERKLTFSNNNKFESERVEAEKLRCIAEDKRVTAEKARANAEEERIKAETRRENTYTDFNDSEVERRNNEANRVRAEAERVNAESGRNELFNTNEEKRNSTFIESERTRERAFNEAQSNRNEAFEESERVREEAFKVSEAARNEAEEGRVAAELLRVEAEKLRVAGEENRNNTFTQSEEERKGIFEEAENARKATESKRVKAESSRVEAEKLRVAAETERVEAENLRVAAEEKRVAAETKRDEKIKELENKIDNGGNNSKNEEVIQARTATTGEVFNTLDERIDNEVDRLNKKIDVTMLQQEDKGSHLVENAVEGMTTDMVIKGRTLQNLVNIKTYNKDKEYEFNSRYSRVLIRQFMKGKLNDKYYFKVSLTKISECTLSSKYDERPFVLTFLGSGGYQNDHFKVKDWKSIKIGETIIVEGERQCSINENDRFEISVAIGISYEYDGSEAGTTGKFKVNDCIITKDFKANSFFEGIKSFGEQEDKISILSHGKNLWNKELFVPKLLDENSWGSSGAYRNNIQKIYLYEGTYKVSIPEIIVPPRLYPILMIKDDNNNQLAPLLTTGAYSNGDSDTNKIVAPREFTMRVPKEGYYNLNAYFLNGFSQSNLDKYKTILEADFQIEQGNVKTAYEPYKKDKKDILLSHYGFDEGLRGLSPTVYDELNDIKNMAIKRIEKYKFLGTEQISLNGKNNNTIEFVINIPSLNIKNSSKLICNNLINIDSGDKRGIRISINGKIVIHLLKTELASEDVAGCKSFLEANPTTIYYELAEPVETPLDESINLKVFNEKTYVSFENTISGTSSFKAPVNAEATISRLNRENRALEEENAKLKAKTYKNTEDIIITNEELQITQSAVDHLLFSNLNADGVAMLYNCKKKGGGSMGAYLAMRIIKGKLKYKAVMKQYGEFKEDIDLILEAEGYGHLITQQ